MRVACLTRGAILAVLAALEAWAGVGAEGATRYWIFFVDKGPRRQVEALLKSGEAGEHLSPRALEGAPKSCPRRR